MNDDLETSRDQAAPTASRPFKSGLTPQLIRLLVFLGAILLLSIVAIVFHVVLTGSGSNHLDYYIYVYCGILFGACCLLSFCAGWRGLLVSAAVIVIGLLLYLFAINDLYFFDLITSVIAGVACCACVLLCRKLHVQSRLKRFCIGFGIAAAALFLMLYLGEKDVIPSVIVWFWNSIGYYALFPLVAMPCGGLLAYYLVYREPAPTKQKPIAVIWSIVLIVAAAASIVLIVIQAAQEFVLYHESVEKTLLQAAAQELTSTDQFMIFNAVLLLAGAVLCLAKKRVGKYLVVVCECAAIVAGVQSKPGVLAVCGLLLAPILSGLFLFPRQSAD